MKDKKINVSKKEMVKEHKRIVPKLKRAGLLDEALEQARELKELKRK